MRAIIIGIIFALLSGCATNGNSDSSANSWVGKSADALMQQKGAPNIILPSGRGTTNFVYVDETRQTYPTTMSNPTVIVAKGKSIAANVPQTASNTGSFRVVKCTTTFEVNKNHVVIGARAVGNNCD